MVLQGGSKNDPVHALRRPIRKDCGKVSLDRVLAEHLLHQYHDHQDWSYQRHYDNLPPGQKLILRWDHCNPIPRCDAT